MRFSLSPGKKFISTLVPSGWVLWSRACGSIRLHSPLCSMVPPFLIMPSGQQYPLSFHETKQKKKEKKSFGNQKHYVVPQITADTLPPGSEFTHAYSPLHGFYIQFVRWKVFVKDVFNGVTGVWLIINKADHWDLHWEHCDITGEGLGFLGKEDLIWIWIWI